MSEEIKLNNEDLKSYVRRKIEELRNELQYLEELLKILEGERSLDSSVMQASRVDVITAGSSVVANVIVSQDVLRIILTEALPADHPLMTSFLVRILEEQRSRGLIEAYRVNEKRGYVYDIEVRGRINNLLYRELEAAVSYVWTNLHERTASQP
ncbi:MAG: hypothetical protein QXP80_07430 [Zestosphaera sp.]